MLDADGWFFGELQGQSCSGERACGFEFLGVVIRCRAGKSRSDRGKQRKAKRKSSRDSANQTWTRTARRSTSRVGTSAGQQLVRVELRPLNVLRKIGARRTRALDFMYPFRDRRNVSHTGAWRARGTRHATVDREMPRGLLLLCTASTAITAGEACRQQRRLGDGSTNDRRCARRYLGRLVSPMCSWSSSKKEPTAGTSRL